MSNMTKQFKAKAKRGLCLAEGFVPEQQPVNPQPFGAGVDGIDGMSLGGDQTYGDLKNMDRLTAGQFTNDPTILNAAMDREGPKRYLDYSPQPVRASRTPPTPLQRVPPKTPAPRITAFDEALQPTTLRQARVPSGFADGMTPHEGPGIVHGPGGPREDKVDAKLSNGEAVLPAATVEALGGAEQVAQLIEQTNGKAPTMGLRDGTHANTGGFVDDFGNFKPPTKFQPAAQNAVLQQQAGYATGVGQTMAPNAGPTLPADTTRTANGFQSARQPGAAASPQAQAYMNQQSANVGPQPKQLGTVSKAAGLSGALGYLGPIANGVGAGMLVANAIDSFPSLRGRATAEASNMELAGTPQHDAEVNKALVAQDAAWEERHGKTLSDAQRTPSKGDAPPVIVKAKTTPATGDYNSGYDAKEAARAKAAPIMVAEQNPNVLDLRAAGVTGPMMGDETVNGKTPKQGIRTIATGSGNVYAGRDAKGQLIVNSGLEKGSQADMDKARDAEFAAKGYGKDAYGNWMTPERIAAKSQLRDAQYQNAKFNATSDQITDPNARAAGLRGLAQYDVEEKQKAEVAKNTAAAENNRIGHLLTERGQNITLAGHKAMQGNTENAARAARDKDRRSRAKDMLDMHATGADKDGKPVMNTGLRAELERAYLGANGGRLMDLPDEGPDGYEVRSTQAINQARLSHAVKTAMQKDKAGWNFNNVFKKANTTLNAAEMSYDDSTDTLNVGGYKLKGKDVWGDDSDLANLVQTRKPKAQ